MLWRVLSLFLAPVTGHYKRVVAVLHALVSMVFRFEHIEGYSNVSAFDLAVFANTQRPQYEHMNIVHQFSSCRYRIRITLLCRAATRQELVRRCKKGEH